MKPRLLVVDDDEDTRRLLEYRFAQEGFEVQTAASGEEAIERAVLFAPAVILLDIVLPDMDGFSVCDRLHSEPLTAQTPIIVLSSYSGMAVHARAIESGVRCCFQKSGNLPALIQVVRSILAATCGGGKIEPEAIVA